MYEYDRQLAHVHRSGQKSDDSVDYETKYNNNDVSLGGSKWDGKTTQRKSQDMHLKWTQEKKAPWIRNRNLSLK